jgi:branched-chain amino acid transport system substrate-binding protein
MKNVRRGSVAGLALSAVLLAGCATGPAATEGASTGDADTGSATETFTIGVASGQTGYMAPFDAAILAGVEQKVKELNAGGGFAGKYPIELVVVDTRSDIGEQAASAQRLIDDGADALFLSCDSDPSISGGQVAQREGIVAFGCPSNPGQIGEFLFQMYLPERTNPTVMAEFALKEGWTKAFTIGSPDTAYTQNGVEYFTTAYEERGGTVIDSGTFGLDQQDYSTLVNRIKASDAEVVWTMMYEPNIVSFLNQLRGAGVDLPVLGDSLETPGVQAMSPEVRKDLYYSAIADTNPGTPTGDYLAEIAEEFGPDSASIYALLGHDAMVALDTAIRNTGTTEPSALAAEIASLVDFAGKAGPVSYAWEGSDNSQLRRIYVKSPLGGIESEVRWEVTPDPTGFPPVIG